METARHPEGSTYAEITWNRMQSSLPVEVIILARIQDIEARHPESYGCCQQQDAGIQTAAHCDPGSTRCDPERKSKHQVRPSRHPLCIGVEEQDEKRNWRKQERQTIQLARGYDKYSARHHNKRHNEGGR